MNLKLIDTALAKYAGWEHDIAKEKNNCAPWHNPQGGFEWGPPSYTISYLAILPLIQKLPEGNTYSSNPNSFPRRMFGPYLAEQLGLKLYDNGTWIGPYDFAWLLFQATPLQLSVAVLKAVNLWKDEYANT